MDGVLGDSREGEEEEEGEETGHERSFAKRFFRRALLVSAGLVFFEGAAEALTSSALLVTEEPGGCGRIVS
jgi:hypothetical protein